MGVTTLNDLPPVPALNGGELCFIYQFWTPTQEWITYSCTTAQIAGLFEGGGGVATCSMRQLFAAMASEDLMITAFEQLPADITDTYNIAWNYAFRMTLADPFITGFLQPALSFTSGQMAALFVLALTFPV